MAGNTGNLSSPPNKRRKSLKAKIESEEDPIRREPQESENSASPPQSQSNSCAICYLDDEQAVRGIIDCCDHYFCFFCIMEWSKTESRCPLCRRRFTTIHRPAKAGVFSRRRTVKVPLRDQEYIHSYEQVECNVCRLAMDESHLLLCDHCNGAAHTYCVGLGTTVPRGDWFCQDCTALRAGNDANSDSDDTDDVRESDRPHSPVVNRYMMRIPQHPNQSSDITPPAVPDRSTSIADEVAEAAISLPSVANRPSESVARTLPSVTNRPTESIATTIPSVANRPTESVPRTLPSVSNRPIESVATTLPSVAIGPTESVARTVPRVVNRPTESVARTLARCRNVHTHIQAFRENWNAFQSGSLSFRSTSCISGCSSSNTSGSDDVDKAWRMMAMARSMQNADKKCSSSVQFSKLPSSRTGDSKKRTRVNSCFRTSGQAQSSSCQRPANQVGCGSHYVDLKALNTLDTIKSEQNVHRKTSSAVQHPKLLSSKASTSEEAMSVRSSFHISKSQQLGALDRRRTGMEAYKCDYREKEIMRYQSVKLEKERPFSRNLNRSTLLQRNRKQAPENDIDERVGSSCSRNEGPSSSFDVKPELRTSSSIRFDVQKRNIGGAESCVGSKVRKYDDAKSEIVSLVKINLKLLSKDKPLGVDAFKQIARRSTHTILAACGFEHPKSGMPSFPNIVCCHIEPHNSSLMPQSCRDCFYGFVKDVVSSILCLET